MLQNMLARMASKLGKSEDDMPSDEMDMNDSEMTGPGDEDTDKAYKAGAIIAEFRPKLQEALRKKDPAKYDEFMSNFTKMRQEATELFKQGKNEEGKKKMQESQDYAQKSDMETYLEPEEVKQVLGKDYDTYMKAVSTAFSNPLQTKSKRLTGQKEQDEVNAIPDIKFGRRMMTMPVAMGTEKVVGGKVQSAKFYKYDPKTKSVVIDTERSVNY